MLMVRKILAASAVVLLFCGAGTESADARSSDHGSGVDRGNMNESHGNANGHGRGNVGDRSSPSNQAVDLPPGLEKRRSLPPGLARHESLPPGLAKGHPTPPGLAGQPAVPSR